MRLPITSSAPGPRGSREREPGLPPGLPPEPLPGAAGAAGAAAFMNSSNETLLPPCTTAIGSTLPSFSVKIVISAFLRSPFSSNSILPVAPL